MGGRVLWQRRWLKVGSVDMVDTIIILILVAIAFAAGVMLTERFYAKAAAEQKAALERQFLRFKAGSDADDPCRPYVYAPQPVNPIGSAFMDTLKREGKAKTKFRKSDLVK